MRDHNQQTRVLIELREKIFDGAFPPGTRLAEIPLAHCLAASRTPVRLALARLEQEGLIVQLPAGGFVVRAFRIGEIADAIKLRGVLEGLAARLVAEKGVTRQLSRDVRECLEDGDGILAGADLSYQQFQDYIEMNRRFHDRILKAADNDALERALRLNDKLPFAAADALVAGQAFMPNAQRLLVFAHTQHHRLVEALESGEGVHAQAIAEQHAQNAIHNLRAALEASNTAHLSIPGLSLLQLPQAESNDVVRQEKRMTAAR